MICGSSGFCKMFLAILFLEQNVNKQAQQNKKTPTVLDLLIVMLTQIEVNMAGKALKLRSDIIQRLSSMPQFENVLHHFIDDWILFQRNSFDHYNETGDPFVSQIFLIEISSGRYIHRSQGQKVDQGTSLDLEVLTGKLTHVFHNTKPCSGVPIQRYREETNMLVFLDYPYERYASERCQLYYDAPHVKKELEQDTFKNFLSCPSCQEAWQDMCSQSMEGFEEPDHLENDPLEVSNPNIVVGHPQDSLKAEDFAPSAQLLDLDDEVVNSDEVGDLWSDQNLDPQTPESPPLNEELDPSVKSSSEKLTKKDIARKGKPFKCKCCSKSFARHFELMTHRKKRNLGKRAHRKVGCLECDKEDIITFKQLGIHVAEEHPDKIAEYEKYQPKDQDTSQMFEPLKCVICDFMTNGVSLSSRHKELYHEVGNHLCQVCQTPNLTYYDLVIHNYQKHRKPTEYLSPSVAGLAIVVKDDGKVQLKRTSMSFCHLCPKVYNKSCGLFNHLKTHHSWGVFNCNSCDETCHYPKDLSAHVLQFHGDNPEIKCPICLKDWNLENGHEVFNDHIKDCISVQQKKEREKYVKYLNPKQCEVCGKCFFSKQGWQSHMNVHRGIRRFQCSYCEFGTSYKDVLQDHEQAHKPSQPSVLHQCQQCGKILKTAKTLNRHDRVVHKGKKGKFQCKDCGEFCKHSVGLYKHKREHHGYVPKSKRM